MKLTDEELNQILSTAGLRMNQPYSSNNNYRQDEYIFTQCCSCGAEAHYRLKYILHKNKLDEKTCRVCYWRAWYGVGHKLYDSEVQRLIADGMSRKQLIEQGVITQERDLKWKEAQDLAETNGYALVDLLHGDRAGDDILITRCLNCGRQDVKRPGDAAYRCTCGGIKVKHGVPYSDTSNNVPRDEKPRNDKQYQTGENKALLESGAACLAWWDAQLNGGSIPADLTCRSRKVYWWRCPNCKKEFKAPVFAMSENPKCPTCLEKELTCFLDDWDQFTKETVADYPELLKAWEDERDPRCVPITHIYTCKFRCPEGHHPNQTPYSYLTKGCMICRRVQTQSLPNQVFLREANPELSAEWLKAVDGEKYNPDTVKPGSKRSVVWKCIACGGTWTDTVREREKREKDRCPYCGKVMGSLAWKYPSLAQEWHPDNPLSPWNIKPYSKLDFRPKWICSKDASHIWCAPVSLRIKSGKNCPLCEMLKE